jgi:hypothetical protein
VLLLIGSLPDGRDVSSKLILTCGGRAAQLYGGLTDAGGDLRAGHFFEWQAIVRSKAAGARIFDMWGRSTPGIAHFKQGFGGRVVEYGGTWDLVAQPLVHAFYEQARRGFVALARRRRGLGASSGEERPASDAPQRPGAPQHPGAPQRPAAGAASSAGDGD